MNGYFLPIPSYPQPNLFACVLSHVLLCSPWTVATSSVHLSMGSSRQEYWNRLPFPSPGDLPDPGIFPTPGIKPTSLTFLALAGGLFTTGTTHMCSYHPLSPLVFFLITLVTSVLSI